MYKHTQTGWVTIISLGVALMLVLIVPKPTHDLVSQFIIPVILSVVCASFLSLTVSVDQNFIKLIFGIGLFRKSVRIDEIKSIKAMRNKWWCGYGIHGCWGKGWLYNVSGLDAIELTMKNGMIYRIGTDDPKKLKDAIQQYIA